jgi:hypothetical protein
VQGSDILVRTGRAATGWQSEIVGPRKSRQSVPDRPKQNPMA